MILPKAVVAGIRWNKYRVISDAKFSFVLVAFEALTALTIAAFATLLFLLVCYEDPIPYNFKLASFAICALFVFFMSILFLCPGSIFINKTISILSYFQLTSFLAEMVGKWKDTAELLNISKAKNFWTVFLISSISHFFFLIGAYYLFVALDIQIDFAAVAWIRSAVFIFVSIPISLAGIGIREVGFIALFGLYGLEPGVVLAYALLALVIQLVIGFIGIFTELGHWFSNERKI